MKIQIASLANAVIPTCGGAGTFQLTVGLSPTLVDSTLWSAIPPNGSTFSIGNMMKLIAGVAQAANSTD